MKSLYKDPVLVCKGCYNKIPQTGWLLNNRNLFSQSSGGWKQKNKVLAELVSHEVSLLCLQMAAFLLCLHMAFPLCTSTPGIFPLLVRTPVKLDQGSILMASINLNYLLKAISPNTITRARASTYEFWGEHNSVHYGPISNIICWVY